MKYLQTILEKGKQSIKKCNCDHDEVHHDHARKVDPVLARVNVIQKEIVVNLHCSEIIR